MSDLVQAVAAAGLVAASAAGAGALVCWAASDWSSARRWLVRLITGLAALPLAQLVLHELAGVRVSPLLATALGGAGLVVAALQERRWRGRAPADPGAPLAIALAIGLFATALTGLLHQPGFDGLDPWRHAFGARFVADTGQLRQPDASFPLVHYVDAYPPAFEILLAQPVAILGTTSAAVKGVAALLVGLAPLALWLLAGTLWRDHRLAGLATILYAVLVNAVPRHLWGHSVAVVLGLGGLAAACEARRASRWLAAVVCCFGGALLAAPSQGLKLGILLLATAAVAAARDRRWLVRLVAGGAAALALAALWLVPAAARNGGTVTGLVRAMQPPELRRADTPLTAIGPGREAPAPWTPKPQDLVGAGEVLFFRPLPVMLETIRGRRVNLVVTPGLGVPLVLLLLAGVTALRTDREALVLPVAWLAISGLLVAGAWLGIAFFPWRSWLLVAPFAALMGAAGLAHLVASARGWRLAALAVAGFAAALALGFDLSHGLVVRQLAAPVWLATLGVAGLWAWREARGLPHRWTALALIGCHLLVAAPVRAASLLEPLPPRVFHDAGEHLGYLGLAASLPRGTRVWPLSGGLRFDILVALDLGCTPWAADELAMARRCSRGELPDPDELVAWLRAHRYQFVVVDPSVAELQRALGRDAAIQRLCDALDAEPGLAAVAVGLPSAEPDTGLRVWNVADMSHRVTGPGTRPTPGTPLRPGTPPPPPR